MIARQTKIVVLFTALLTIGWAGRAMIVRRRLPKHPTIPDWHEIFLGLIIVAGVQTFIIQEVAGVRVDSSDPGVPRKASTGLSGGRLPEQLTPQIVENFPHLADLTPSGKPPLPPIYGAMTPPPRERSAPQFLLLPRRKWLEGTVPHSRGGRRFLRAGQTQLETAARGHQKENRSGFPRHAPQRRCR